MYRRFGGTCRLHIQAQTPMPVFHSIHHVPFFLSALKAVILAFTAQKPQISFKENCTALVVKSSFHSLDLGWL